MTPCCPLRIRSRYKLLWYFALIFPHDFMQTSTCVTEQRYFSTPPEKAFSCTCMFVGVRGFWTGSIMYPPFCLPNWWSVETERSKWPASGRRDRQVDKTIRLGFGSNNLTPLGRCLSKAHMIFCALFLTRSVCVVSLRLQFALDVMV